MVADGVGVSDAVALEATTDGLSTGGVVGGLAATGDRGLAEESVVDEFEEAIAGVEEEVPGEWSLAHAVKSNPAAATPAAQPRACNRE
jgi:hypothetical protein